MLGRSIVNNFVYVAIIVSAALFALSHVGMTSGWFHFSIYMSGLFKEYRKIGVLEIMEIRKCEQRDVVLVGAFYDKVVEYLDQNINYPKWTYKEYPSEQSVRNAVQKGHQFMCIEDGEIIGAFVLNDDPQGQYENATWSKSLKRGEYMVCHSLASDPAVKGKGVGTKMVLYCIEYAGKQGYQSIRLDVVPDNIPAKRLYEKCGFQYVGDVDLERNIAGIPLFSMYELKL